MTKKNRYLILALLAGISCDPRAKAGTSGGRSLEYENCQYSGDCAGASLRCVEHICREQQVVPVAEYYAASARKALADGKPADAVQGYEEALNRYKGDPEWKQRADGAGTAVEPPAALECEYGSALTAVADKPDFAEQAAIALHSCIARMPKRSRWYREALTALAHLGTLGLNPEILAQKVGGQRYMTQAPKRQSFDKATIEVVPAFKAPTAVSFQAFTNTIKDNMRSGLVACFKKAVESDGANELVVELDVKHAWQESKYEEDDGWKLRVTPAAKSNPCVVDVLKPLAKEKLGRGAWRGKVTVKMTVPQE